MLIYPPLLIVSRLVPRRFDRQETLLKLHRHCSQIETVELLIEPSNYACPMALPFCICSQEKVAGAGASDQPWTKRPVHGVNMTYCRKSTYVLQNWSVVTWHGLLGVFDLPQ